MTGVADGSMLNMPGMRPPMTDAPSARAPSSSFRLKFDGKVSIGHVSLPPSASSPRSVGTTSFPAVDPLELLDPLSFLEPPPLQAAPRSRRHRMAAVP